jgi:hypothetical protein
MTRKITRVLIEGGAVFDGTLDQLDDCFYLGRSEATISGWANRHGWSAAFEYETPMNIQFYYPTKSSFVERIAYREDGELQVTIVNDSGAKSYQYHAIKSYIFEMWRSADSAGRFYNEFVKGHDGEEITIDEEWDDDSLSISGSASPGN